ncbi:hypothetical protein QN277_022746 [Acacia crassicarpa]|uniref:Uncharacterized protein n=1 Tax=Acacia crassicarpa TaxID=499986 RepID=A0AAE1JIJ2_9FABA|nr:hypothetical protein QN277_022746 [Acacia crassicarpa]
MDPATARDKSLLQLHELDEFCLGAYENSKLYKEKIKRWHDKRLMPRTFEVGQKVLLYNSRLKFFPGKLKSRWTGPFVIDALTSHGAVDLRNPVTANSFRVNGQRIKHYWSDPMERDKLSIELKST